MTGKSGITETVLNQIKLLAERNGVGKVILFGSRARGDHKERSDIDLAASGGNVMLFALDVDEETDTLLQYDIVNLDGPVQPELLENIRHDGVTLYEKIR